MRVPLLWHLVKQDLLTRYAGSILGTLWLFAFPLTQIFIFTLIFGTIIGPRLGGAGQTPFAYAFYLMAGVLPWGAFASTVTRTSTAFIDKAGIITKVSLGLGAVAVHYAVAEGIVLAFILLLLVVVMTALGRPPSALLVWLPLLVVFQQVIAFTIGLAGAILTVFVRDIKEVVGVVMMVWFWLTPIVYTAADAHALLRLLQRANPAFWFIEPYHQILATGQTPNLAAIAAEGAAALALAGLMLWVLARVERDIRDLL
jgi:lipopolysaccharide transport system permease protein